jgi:hypothetical protein
VAFAINYHGSTNAGLRDPTVSPWRFAAGMTLNHNNVVRTLCPGRTTTVTWSFGNVGKVNITAPDPAQVRVVWSNDSTISVGDRTLLSGTFFAHRGGFGTTTWTFTVPSVSPGTYTIGVIADPANLISETDGNNNSARTGLRIRIPSTGC